MKTVARGIVTALAAASAVLLALPRPAPGQVACHCFRDREYDPANPSKSDTYALATSENSFLAAAFGVPKRDLVQAKMSGARAEDLWVALYAGARLGVPAGQLRDARGRASSWRDAFAQRGTDGSVLGASFQAALDGGAGDADLADAALCETAAVRLGADRARCAALLRGGAGRQGALLALLLARWTGSSPEQVVAESRAAGGAWSASLARAGRTPAQLERDVAALLAAGPAPSPR